MNVFVWLYKILDYIVVFKALVFNGCGSEQVNFEDQAK